MFDTSILANYRFAYKQKHNADYLGTDEELRQIIKQVGALPTSRETDEAVLEEMSWIFGK